jgi:myo-inositol-1(or 4)-monophosphatase
MNHEFAQYLAAAWDAASSAGKLIRDNWEAPKQISFKGAIDLVTSIDRGAEKLTVEALHRKFPSHSILAEEDTMLTGTEDTHRWIIDPLDGTTNFAHSYPHFCVSIALEIQTEVLLGLVYDPLREECFCAVRGDGATLNGKRIHVSATAELDKSLLATGFPYDRRERADEYLAVFKAFITRSQGVRRNGSAALDLCYVACGRIDGFWEAKLRPWDVAAGAIIIREAGGVMSGYSGGQFSIWGDETLASNGVIHEQMITVLR